MKRFKKLLAVFAAAVITVTSIPVIANTTVYADEYTIRLDGKKLNTSQPIVNVNNRILIPYRELAEAMDGLVGWDPKTATVSIYRGNIYSRLQIGDDTLYYGKFGYDEDGEIVELTQKWEIMDVEATIINNSTYIPVRAVAEALGAEVDWKDGIAYITSSDIEEPSEIDKEDDEKEKEDEKKSANYGDFSNTTYFRIISSETAKNRYQDANNDPFIFVLYDSSSDSAKRIVPNIQDAAADAKTRIYAVDMNDSTYSAKDVNFLWNYVKESDFEDPTVYFVYSKKDIDENIKPSDMSKLSDQIAKFEAKAESEYDLGDYADTTYFKSRTLNNIKSMYEDGDEFMLLLYDSTDDDSELYVPLVKSAAKNKKQLIYGLNIDKYPKFYNIEFLEDYEDDIDGNLPILFLVYNSKYDIEAFEQPTNVSEIEDYIDEFLDYAEPAPAYKDLSNGNLINSKITSVQNSYNNKETFVLFLYNSQDADSETTANYIADSIFELRYDYSIPFYGVNESSTTASFSDNKDSYFYEWLFNNTKVSSSASRPMLIYIKNGSVEYVDSSIGSRKSNIKSNLQTNIDKYLK